VTATQALKVDKNSLHSVVLNTFLNCSSPTTHLTKEKDDGIHHRLPELFDCCFAIDIYHSLPGLATLSGT
jgi:hypothetical protein